MEWIMGLFVANWVEVSGVIALVILIADRIAKLTPTKTDDAVMAIVNKIATVLAIRVKDNPGKVDVPVAPSAPVKVDRAVK
jgi:hypothetical protein